MSFSKALYYPQVDITNEHWLKNAILFWDEIRTIVPFSNRNPYLSHTTQFLQDEGILNPYIVNPDHKLVMDLGDDVVNFMGSSEASNLLFHRGGFKNQLHVDKLPREIIDINFSRIHPDKLSYLILNRMERMFTEDGWLLVESGFAMYYMTLLANRICEHETVALLTDNQLSSNLSEAVRLDGYRDVRNGDIDFYSSVNRVRKTQSLAQGLLVNLVIEGINVSNNTSINDLVNYKIKYKDELGRFRTNIARLTKEVPEDLTLKELKEYIYNIYTNEFSPSFNDLKKSLHGAGIKWTADNFLKITMMSAVPTAAANLLGLEIPHAIIAAGSISLIASLVSYNMDKQEKLRSNPYSYLLNLK